MYYITFDGFSYSWIHYNDFIENARRNGLKFQEYIANRSQYKWYIGLERKSDFPKFLKFSVTEDNRYLFAKINAMTTSEANYLMRRQDVIPDIEKFVSPRVFQHFKKATYGVVFKYQGIEKLKNASLAGIKSYIIGKQGPYKLAICLNKYINNYITKSDILIEKTIQSQYSRPLQLEYELKNNWLKSHGGIKNKIIDYPFVENGSLRVPPYPLPNGFWG